MIPKSEDFEVLMGFGYYYFALGLLELRNRHCVFIFIICVSCSVFHEDGSGLLSMTSF